MKNSNEKIKSAFAFNSSMPEKENIYIPKKKRRMSKDNAPVPNTCPTIDIIVESIHHGEYDKEELIELIENVRTDNAKLRNWGNELHSRLN